MFTKMFHVVVLCSVWGLSRCQITRYIVVVVAAVVVVVVVIVVVAVVILVTVGVVFVVVLSHNFTRSGGATIILELCNVFFGVKAMDRKLCIHCFEYKRCQYCVAAVGCGVVTNSVNATNGGLEINSSVPFEKFDIVYNPT